MASAAVSRGASAIGDDRRGPAVDGDLHARAALRRRARPRARPRPSRAMPSRSSSRGVADGERGGRRRWRAAPWPGTASKRLGARHAASRARRGLDDGLGERVLAVALGGGDQAQQLVLVDAVGGGDRDDLGLAARERAGLVEDDRVQRGRLLQRHRVLEQDAALGAQAGADHDRRRGREPERVRAGDDDDGDREQQRVLDVAADDASTRRRRSARRRRARRARARTRRGRRGAAPGALEFCASWTSLTICASAVSEPTAVARARSVPFLLMVAPMSWSPGASS